MSRQKKPYTKPVIVRSSNGDWFVFFRFLDVATGKYKAIKLREDLNRIKDSKEKEAEFKALREAREIWLASGWNPITNSFPAADFARSDISQLQEMTLPDALNFAFNKRSKDWARKTRQDYNSKLKYFLQSVAALNLTRTRITDVRRPHYKLILENVQESRQLSGKGYNLYREFVSSLVGELVQWEALEYNPIEKIATKQVIKTISFRPPTRDQQLLIMNRIRAVDRNYYRFLAVLYGCTIRPKEITGLKIKNLHKLQQVFRLIPDSNSSTKTKIEREVIIPDWLMDLLSELNLHNYDPEWYIFSSLPGRHGKTFLPGPKRMHSNTPTAWWRNIVKVSADKGGLGLDIDQYSLKKLAGDDMIRLQRQDQADKLLELPKMQMGHASTQMTEVYVGEHKEIMRELIKKKMPVL